MTFLQPAVSAESLLQQDCGMKFMTLKSPSGLVISNPVERYLVSEDEETNALPSTKRVTNQSIAVHCL